MRALDLQFPSGKLSLDDDFNLKFYHSGNILATLLISGLSARSVPSDGDDYDSNRIRTSDGMLGLGA